MYGAQKFDLQQCTRAKMFALQGTQELEELVGEVENAMAAEHENVRAVMASLALLVQMLCAPVTLVLLLHATSP